MILPLGNLISPVSKRVALGISKASNASALVLALDYLLDGGWKSLIELIDF